MNQILMPSIVTEIDKVIPENKKLYPKSWEEYSDLYNAKINFCLYSSISVGDDDCKQEVRFSIPNEYSKSFLAFIKLFHLRDCYRHGWKPDESSYCNGDEKYCIWKNYNEDGYVELSVEPIYSSVHFLTFQTYEIAKKFACNFSQLILDADDLIF